MSDNSGVTVLALIAGALLVLVVGLYATSAFTRHDTTDVVVQTPAAPPTVITTPAPSNTVINPPAEPAAPSTSPSDPAPPPPDSGSSMDTTEPPAEPTDPPPSTP